MSTSVESRRLTQWRRPQLSTDGRTVRGLVVPFRRSKPVAGWVEQPAPSFLAKSAGDGFPGVTARFDGWTIGTTPNTLRLTLVDSGLAMSVVVPQSLPFVCEYVERGDLQDVALSWEVYQDRWTHDKGVPVRHLVSGRLREVSLSTSYLSVVDTSAGMRSLARTFGEPVELIADLSERNELWRLWGADHAPAEPVRLGKPGREAHVEIVEAAEVGAPIVDEWAVKATPADLASKG